MVNSISRKNYLLAALAGFILTPLLFYSLPAVVQLVLVPVLALLPLGFYLAYGNNSFFLKPWHYSIFRDDFQKNRRPSTSADSIKADWTSLQEDFYFFRKPELRGWLHKRTLASAYVSYLAAFFLFSAFTADVLARYSRDHFMNSPITGIFMFVFFYSFGMILAIFARMFLAYLAFRKNRLRFPELYYQQVKDFAAEFQNAGIFCS